MKKRCLARDLHRLCRCILAIAAVLAPLSCASPHVDLADPGEVSGSLMVFWVGEDNFVYYPFYRDPLTYKLPRSLRDRLGVEAIRPGAIYTDGGSIPRAVRNVVGFSPWGYGPAYVVHDWLFVAHHCIIHDAVYKHDRRDRPQAELVRKVSFESSADILAGVIQALEKQEKVPKRPLAPNTIYSAVDSVIARRLWDSRDPNSCRPVDAKTILDIERKLTARELGIESAGDEKRPPTLVYQQEF